MTLINRQVADLKGKFSRETSTDENMLKKQCSLISRLSNALLETTYLSAVLGKNF